jgi:hypothetical protein
MLTRVQSANAASSGATPTGTINLSGVLAGSLLVVGFRATFTPTTLSVSDSNGNTWHRAFGITNGTQARMELWYAWNVNAGNTLVTISMSPSGTAFWQIVAGEWSGEEISSDPFGFAAVTTGSGTAASSPNITTTNPNSLLIGLTENETANGLTITAGTSFALANSSSGNAAIEDQIVSSTGTFAASFGFSSSVSWACGIASFGAPVAAPPARTPVVCIME